MTGVYASLSDDVLEAMLEAALVLHEEGGKSERHHRKRKLAQGQGSLQDVKKRLRTEGVSSHAASSAAMRLTSVRCPAGEELRTFLTSLANGVSEAWHVSSARLSAVRASDEFQSAES